MQEERQVLRDGIERFPDAAKLHMMLGQLEERLGNPAAARKALQAGLSHNPKAIPMWIMLARLEERQGSVPAARAILDQARLRNAKSADLWRASVRTEIRAGNKAAASATLTRGMQDCAGTPAVGKLWALHINMAERTQRKAKMQDAVKSADSDPHVFAAVGAVFVGDRKYDKARKFFERATALDGDVGDFWGMWLACEETAKNADAAAKVIAAAKQVRARRNAFASALYRAAAPTLCQHAKRTAGGSTSRGAVGAATQGPNKCAQALRACHATARTGPDAKSRSRAMTNLRRRRTAPQPACTGRRESDGTRVRACTPHPWRKICAQCWAQHIANYLATVLLE